MRREGSFAEKEPGAKGDGGGLDAKDSLAEGNGVAAGTSGEVHFLGGEPPFRPDDGDDGLVRSEAGGALAQREGIGPGRRDQAQGIGFGRAKGGVIGQRGGDLHKACASGLFGGLDDNAPPAGEVILLPSERVNDTAGGDHRGEALEPQFAALLDEGIHARGSGQGIEQGHTAARFGVALFKGQHMECGFAAAGFHEARAGQATGAVEEFDLLPEADANDVEEVVGLLVAQDETLPGLGQGFDEEPAQVVGDGCGS